MQQEDSRPMQMKRPLLYLGLALVAIGGVTVAADAGAVDTATLTDLLRLWPIALIAIGAGLVLRRTRVSLAGGMLAAAAPGLLIGSAFAVVPRFAGDCGARAEPALTSTQHGSFVTVPSITVLSGCGTFNIRTAPGNGWQLDSGNSTGLPVEIDAFGDELLQIESPAGRGWGALGGGRDRWELTLPAAIGNLQLDLDASRSYLGLAGTRIDVLGLTANSSDVVLDLAGSSIQDLHAVVNAGVMSIHLPTGADLAGTLRVNGGELQLCAPDDVGLSVSTGGSFRQVSAAGRRDVPSEWRSAGYDSAQYHVDLSVKATFGTVAINPIGGCR